MKNNEKYSSIKHRFKLLTTILSWTIFVLLILIATILVYYFVTTRIYAKKNVNYRPAFGLYTIISPSMEKTLNIYDVIVNVKVKNPNDIKVGDIITFISTSASSKGMTITHRVIEITDGENGKLYKTKGDNNTSPDPKPATFENVIGKVIFKIPQLGRLQSILTTKMGWLILVVIPAFIIILFDILKLIRLHGAEKSIEEVTIIDNKRKENEEKNKKLIEEKLTKKYKTKRRNADECDPLTKKSIIVEVNDDLKETKEENKEEVKIKEERIIDDDIITKEELIEEYTNNGETSEKDIEEKESETESETVEDTSDDERNVLDNESDERNISDEESETESKTIEDTSDEEKNVLDDESDERDISDGEFETESKTIEEDTITEEDKEKIEDIIEDIINPEEKKEQSLEENHSSNSKDKKVRTRKKKKKKKN